MTEKQTYYGRWFFPTGVSSEDIMQYEGTLKIDEDNHCVLTIQGELRVGGNLLEQIDVSWGIDKRGNKYTLLGLYMSRWNVGDQMEYNAKYIIVGAHINSLDEPFFNECNVKFPYLQNWTEASMIAIPHDYNKGVITIDYNQENVFLQGELDDGIRYKVVDRTVCKLNQLELSAKKATRYDIVSERLLSISEFSNYIQEFAQFLSLALFSKQQPTAITFRKKGEDSVIQMLFVASSSHKPGTTPLIPITTLKERIPIFIKRFHSIYDKIETLTRYLITSLHVGDFDAPIFIIVAQALEGYYQRFLKGTAGVSNKKWEALINRFKDIEAVKNCTMNADLIKDTRDKYSHLYDDEPKEHNIPTGKDLLYLTQKCKILLTCCIMEQIGMTHDEINTSINGSEVRFIEYNVMKYETQKKMKIVYNGNQGKKLRG